MCTHAAFTNRQQCERSGKQPGQVKQEHAFQKPTQADYGACTAAPDSGAAGAAGELRQVGAAEALRGRRQRRQVDIVRQRRAPQRRAQDRQPARLVRKGYLCTGSVQQMRLK